MRSAGGGCAVTVRAGHGIDEGVGSPYACRMRVVGVLVMGCLLAIACAKPKPEPAPPVIAAPPPTQVQTFSATAYSIVAP